MATALGTESTALSSLEVFVRDYMEVTGGAWEEVEPQVYDVLLPQTVETASEGHPAADIVRIAFDPEAIPEHPGAQLATLGTPLVDRLLANAVQRARCVQMDFVGLNLHPHQLQAQVRRSLTLQEGLSLEFQRVRPLNFAQAIFWFEATFVSDQKEEELLPVAIDLHYGRQVRHLDRLLDPTRLTEQGHQFLPDAPTISKTAAYDMARQRVVRTVAALANTRNRELTERLDRQSARMRRYYQDLRDENQDQLARAQARGHETEKYAVRLAALDREELLRITELKQKSTLRVHLKLHSLLLVRQPKLSIAASVIAQNRSGQTAAPLRLVWDPLTESLEAADCPECKRSTFQFRLTRFGQLVCAACPDPQPAKHTKKAAQSK